MTNECDEWAELDELLKDDELEEEDARRDKLSPLEKKLIFAARIRAKDSYCPYRTDEYHFGYCNLECEGNTCVYLDDIGSITRENKDGKIKKYKKCNYVTSTTRVW